jgi:hypothetical protein
MRARTTRQAKRCKTLAWMGVAATLWTAETAHAGSARDYLNAPIDTWLLNYNAGYTTSLTPEDGTDTVPGVRANVLAQSVVLTRIMDYWGRTGGFSLVLPYALIDTSAGPFRASTNGVSDVGFLWQMNIFGGPAQTRERVPILRAPDVLELSSPGDHADWILPAKLSDQSKRKPLDDLANRQFQLHARSRLDLARDLCRWAHLHRQRQ